MSEDRYGRYGPHLTDGTSTSPELIQPKQRNHRKQQPAPSHSSHSHNQYYAQQVHPGSGPTGTGNSALSSAQAAGGGLGSESSSSRSDSSRTRDTLSTETSHSSEQSGRYSHHAGHSEQHRGSPYETEHLQALQEENADLHQNLLQTVVCIESLEVELQRTRDELNHVKDKYKSLLETHSGTKQANNLLGEHLHIASESLSSERKYMLNRVAQLSSELEDARRTIAALQNINVPCLIKELLEKHFNSAEAIQKFLMTSTPFGHSAASLKTENQSHYPQVEKASCDWLSKTEAGLQQVTAFTPFKQGVPTTEIESHISDQRDSTHSPPLSVADISTAIYKKMAASYAVRPQPLYPPGQQQPSVVTNLADTPPSNLQQDHVGADSWGRKGGVESLLLEQDVVDVTSMSAQQILNDFMQQLQTHKEAGGETQQQGGQEWVGGIEQTSRVAD
ncbi:uncharacterized protein LOC115427003 [Sphaeramia orbicularis]|uniref:uncharacterized protein LOC115427003 n=1 Tax=Sphaeramia orbicularis TaxID=375764 RepID=UPI00117E6F66|nr:uncharacterized protein LOC115427003 [Sphaeramia orbicularis]XP_030001193.1 uncharacterized protein LOC115427003 [Sphaeramia orbicularis]